MKILVVEDHPLASRTAKLILSGLGHEVDIAGDGKSAVEMANKSNYDLIFMDIGLPDGMDGFMTTIEIRKITAYAKTPIVALTAHRTPEHEKKSSEVGMNGFLSKPLTSEKANQVMIDFF